MPILKKSADIADADINIGTPLKSTPFQAWWNANRNGTGIEIEQSVESNQNGAGIVPSLMCITVQNTLS